MCKSVAARRGEHEACAGQVRAGRRQFTITGGECTRALGQRGYKAVVVAVERAGEGECVFVWGRRRPFLQSPTSKRTPRRKAPDGCESGYT